MNRIEYWPMRSELIALTEAHYRDKISERIESLDPLAKVRLVTFDGVAPHITDEAVFGVLAHIHEKVAPGVFHGRGLEVGAGAGFFSALLVRFPGLQEMYAVEISRPIVERLMPEILKAFSHDNEDKVIPCVGDFSSLNLKDESLDFIFDFFSLHHSDDLSRTFSEMARTLKKGGRIVCLDKARADALSNTNLDALLDKEYSNESKKLMGVDPAIKLTRRMNGEREFRLKDWIRYAEGAGLSLSFFTHVAKTMSPNFLFAAIKRTISLLPVKMQMSVTSFFGLAGRKHSNSLETKNLIYASSINLFPKEMSVMIFEK